MSAAAAERIESHVWRITGYMLSLAAVIPVTGWAAQTLAEAVA